MTKEELAAKLNGREMGNEITKHEENQAKESGLVVLFGYSDDNAELRGAIENEVGAYGREEIVILDGELFDYEECECKYAEKALEDALARGSKIKPIWASGTGYSWTYETTIPHATFDVMEGEYKFCRGIVFNLPK